MVAAHKLLLDRRVFGLLDKIGDATICFAFQNPQPGCFALRHGLDRHRYIGVILPVEVRHFGIIHAIQMVAGEDQHILRPGCLDLEQLLAHRVCRALVPVRALRGLLRRPDLDPAGMEHVKVIRLGNMPVERDGVELGQNGNPVDPRVDAVADRNIDETILAGDGHGRLRAHFGEEGANATRVRLP